MSKTGSIPVAQLYSIFWYPTHHYKLKGDALFQTCRFEHALVNYERGIRVSVEPLLSRFLGGRNRASESIM